MRKCIRDSANEGKHWSENLTSGLQTVTSGISGIMMISGAIGSLSDAMAEGEASFGDYLSATLSMLFGLMQLLPVFTKVGEGLKKMKKLQDADTVSK
jgi:hypothetical protein